MEQVQKPDRRAFSPHAVRHLFVTQHLVWIKGEAGNDQEEQQRLKAGLVQIMGWHSRETMRIYDHTFTIQEAVQKLHAFQKKAEHQVAQTVEALVTRPEESVITREITVIEESEPPNVFAQLWEDML